jgi:hypothetical protein
LNWTLSATVCPGFSVSGKLAPETEKPAPVTVAAVTLVASVPVDESVTDCDTVEFTATPPNEMFVELKLSAREPAALSFNAKLAVAFPAVAVRVAVWSVFTSATVAVKPALVGEEGTVTVDGTLTTGLLLDKLTVVSLVTVPLSVTEHETVAAPVIVALAQVRVEGVAAVRFALPTTPPHPAKAMHPPAIADRKATLFDM